MTTTQIKQVPVMTMDHFIAWMETWTDVDKYELHDGLVVAMSGGTLDNEIIAGNLYYALRNGLRGKPCLPLRDILQRSSANDRFGVFPDVYVHCGARDGRQTSVIDATAAFEVISPSTHRVDRAYKLEQYMAIPAMRHIALVYPREIRVELWSRGAEDEVWPGEPVVLSKLDTEMRLATLDIAIPLAAVYDGTEITSAAA